MKLSKLFHTNEPSEVIESCREYWKLDGRFPRPKFNPECPHCTSTDVQLSRMQFSHQPEKGCPYTADIYFKCRNCSHGPFQFGVKIPQEMYEMNDQGRTGNNRYEWREIRDYWQSEGVLNSN